MSFPPYYTPNLLVPCPPARVSDDMHGIELGRELLLAPTNNILPQASFYTEISLRAAASQNYNRSSKW